MIKRTTTETLRVVGGLLTVGDARGFLDGLPDSARLEVKRTVGDRPGEQTVITLTATVENG